MSIHALWALQSQGKKPQDARVIQFAKYEQQWYKCMEMQQNLLNTWLHYNYNQLKGNPQGVISAQRFGPIPPICPSLFLSS